MRTAERVIRFQVDGNVLEADMIVEPLATGVVVFVHGSGSSRHSRRNQFVAERLRSRGLGTVLMDLLTASEERADSFSGHLRFDIPFLARRVTAIIEQLKLEQSLPLGLFGASTGGAAALVAAASGLQDVRAVVSRGGRPDLAGDALSRVSTPTLLIVGGEDGQVLELNRRAMAQMHAEVKLEIVNGATHLFEEPGALDRVAELAGDWFYTHLGD